MNNFDTYRDAFLRFMAEGMTYAEALKQFDRVELQAAINAELESGDSVQVLNAETMQIESACGHITLFDLACMARFEQRNSVDGHDYQQALELWQAGWTSESPREPTGGFWGQVQVMSWYWRRPPRRKGKPGRKYLSTNQAYQALTRERNDRQ